MVQYQCTSIVNAIKKISFATNTKIESEQKEYLKNLLRDLKKSTESSTTIDYTMFDENDKEKDCSLFLGYCKSDKCYYVGVIL